VVVPARQMQACDQPHQFHLPLSNWRGARGEDYKKIYSMSISKEAILAKTSSYEILNHYLQPYHNEGAKLRYGVNISNPFLSEKQDTPSFNIFHSSKTNEWLYNDFATGDSGSCFDLVMRLNNESFPEALERINRDFCLMLENNQQQKSSTPPPPSTPKTETVKKDFSATKRDFTANELEYWQKFGIGIETLNKFKVTPLSEFSSVSKDGKPYTIKEKPDKFIFAYDHGNWMKLYKPLDEKQYRFQYLGTKPPNYIFGFELLPEKGDLVFITGGEKDCMSVWQKGFCAISLNSETATLDKAITAELKQRFKDFVILYDNDATGIKQAQSLSLQHGLKNLTLPALPDNGKDISDFFATGGTIETLQKWIAEALKKPDVNPIEEDKCTYNAVELLALGSPDPDYLLDKLMHRIGTAVLAGKPDTGKSQLARQLCVQIALGYGDFLGFNINAIHNKAIYVATEDSKESTTFLLHKQLEGLQKQPTENLRFIFGDILTQTEIIAELEKALTEAPVDLVVIDSFSDVFTGTDSNNNMAMRNTVNTFDRVAKKYKCLILFIHHTNKGSYRLAPAQEHIQGGAGLVQKARLAIQLSEGEGNIRIFSIVKGNYCKKEIKDNSMELHFSEETFLFTFDGKLVATKDMGTQSEPKKKELKFAEIKNLVSSILGSKPLSYTHFIDAFCSATEKSPSTAKRALNDLKEIGFIVEANSLYRLNDKTDENKDTPF
jgi:KaiC/GvpD/RAD55 family RecA-like ATPase